MTNSDTSFLKEIQDLPLLNAVREKELGSTIQKGEDDKDKDEAVTELVQHNLKLVVNEAFRYAQCSSVAVEELYNAGRSGLVKAAYKYNPIQFNTRFSTYATPWIRQGMREAIHGDSPVKVPLHIINGMYRKNRAIEGNSDISDEEIREELEVTEVQMDRINKAQVSSISLDMPVGGEDETTTIGDLMTDNEAKIPGDIGVDDPRYEFLSEALEELDGMSKEVIMAQILSADKTKLSDLGEKYGLTGERIRQIKDKALSKLKKKIMFRMRINGRLPDVTPASKDAEEPTPKKRGRPKGSTSKKKVKQATKRSSEATWKRGKHGSVTVNSCYYDGKKVADIRSAVDGSRTVRILSGRNVVKSWSGNGKTIERLKDEALYDI